jgi:tetratricopeptide (TPR) repeat protein
VLLMRPASHSNPQPFPVLFKLLFTFLLACSPAFSQDSATAKPAEPTTPATSLNPPPGQPEASKPAELTAFAQAMEMYHSERYSAAYAQFMDAGKDVAPNSAAAYAWAARTALALKRPEEADSLAKKALELDSNLPTAKSAMGEVYFRQGKFPEAEQAFRAIVLAKIQDPRSLLGLSRLYQATANYKAAKILIDDAHNQDPKDPDIFWTWIRTLKRREKLEAIKARLAAGYSVDPDEAAGLQTLEAVQADREKRPERSCKLVNKVESTETSLDGLASDSRHVRGGGLLVKLNDKGAKLLVDTGASGIIVSSHIAEKAGLTPITSEDISGVGDKGPSHGHIALAEKIQIGALQFENCYVEVLDRKSSLDEEGLIGTDVFEDFLVDLDFPNHKLRLSTLPPYPDEKSGPAGLNSAGVSGPNLHNRYIPPGYEKFERVYRFGHNILVSTQLNNAPQKLFLLDTGAWDNTVSPAAAREATKVHSDPDMKVKGLSGQVSKVYSADELMLKFGKFQQKREDMVAFDMTHISDSIGTEVSGTLGYAMLFLLEIKIDYRDNLVDFSYDPYRFH